MLEGLRVAPADDGSAPFNIPFIFAVYTKVLAVWSQEPRVSIKPVKFKLNIPRLMRRYGNTAAASTLTWVRGCATEINSAN